MPDDRTEPATKKRRKKARDEGQIARSGELAGSAVLLGAIGAMHNYGPAMCARLTQYMTHTISGVRGDASPHELSQLAVGGLTQAGMAVAPVLGAAASAGFAANVAQVGLHATSKQMQPQLNRLDPFSGIKRLFTARGAMELLKNTLKFGLVCWISCDYLRYHFQDCIHLAMYGPADIGSRVGELLYGLAVRVISVLAVLAAADYGWQRWSFEKQIRMSKQEIKDEFKESEGNPQIKMKVRQRQRQASRRRMIAAVPKATVVLMNPTHYAVALLYELGQKGAPRIVAMGKDLIALRIRGIAEASGVPVVVNPPLAQALYKLADIDQEIPQELFRAVAEVLAVVLKLDRARARA